MRSDHSMNLIIYYYDAHERFQTLISERSEIILPAHQLTWTLYNVRNFQHFN